MRPPSNLFIKYRGRLIVVWVVAVLLLASQVPYFLSQLGGVSFTTFGSQAEQTQQLIKKRFPSLPSEQDIVVFHSDKLVVTDSTYRSTVAQSIQSLQGQQYVTSLLSPYGLGAQLQTSADHHTSFLIVGLQGSDDQLQKNAVNLAHALPKPGSDMQLYLTGTSPLNADVNKQEISDITKADMIGLPVAFAVLLLAFGSLVAAGLPLLLADLGIVVSFGLLALLSHFVTFDIFEESAIIMVGLAFGIDYSLMIVTRFREELAAGFTPSDATTRTMRTAGRAVLLSGLTVIAGDCGLLFVRAAFYRNLAIGVIVTVSVMLLLCLTLLPVILAWLGRHINALTVLKSTVNVKDTEQGFWSKWARAIMRRPIVVALATTFILLIVAWPAHNLQLGFNLGTDTLNDQMSAQGLRMANQAFTPGFVSPIQIVVSRAQGAFTNSDLIALSRIQNRLEQEGQVKVTTSLTQTLDALTGRHDVNALKVAGQYSTVLASQLNVANGSNVTIITVIPKVTPDSKQAMQLFDAIRHDIIPAESSNSILQFGFTGITAQIADLDQEVTRAMPIVLTFVLGLAFVLLVIMFRSLILPLKAILMNLLALGATFGLIILVFQNGFGASLLGFTSPGYIQNYLPLLTFVILFGLSMDYEVFLLSRIQEEWRKTGDNATAVAHGLEHTAKVISYAAAIMVVVFSSFLITHILEIKQLGFALAVAVLIDATLIRLLLVPATMRLLGRWNWWAPVWLRLPIKYNQSHMPNSNIVKLLSEKYIDETALPSNIRYGTAIQRRGGVEFITREPSRVEAWVGGLDGPGTEGGSQRRRTQLWVEDGRITWHCAGNPKDHQIFCKHCVALALEILDKEGGQ